VTPQQYSVGGVNDSSQFTFRVHGAPNSEPIVDGQSQVVGGLTNGVFIYNQLTFQEVVVETSGAGADRETGGMGMNIIQRDGGNVFSGGATYSYTGPSLESGNISDEWVARNLRPEQIGGLKKYYDFALALGAVHQAGPRRFFGSFRQATTSSSSRDYFNKRQGSLFYSPTRHGGVHRSVVKDYTPV
jgi:hypothetical protein